jgi:hypothetical protein
MKVDPPTGDEPTELLTTVKARVLREASKTRQRRLRRGLVAFIVTGTTILVIGAAGAAFATDLASGIFHPMPHTTQRPNDPPQPSATPGVASGPIAPEQAPLGQLWAIVDSSLRSDSEWSERGAGQIEPTFLDFETAIENRCEPGLNAAERADLNAKWVRVQQQATDATAPLHDVEKAFFDAATTYCM